MPVALMRMGGSSPGSDTTTGAFTAPGCRELTALLPAFRFQELIGIGSTGAVYRAEQISLGRVAAIKVLPPELSRLESFSMDFKARARAMAKLSHPNLIGVYDFGEVNEMLYLVMEFIDGNTLHESITGSTVDPIQTIGIVEGIAQGLGEAHQHELLHRDIKPASIMITQELKPLLGDFGLAFGSDRSVTGANPVSSRYVAPEVLKDCTAAGPASDVYSLGIIMHELLTGTVPRPGMAPDLDHIPDLKGLRELAAKVLSSDPEQRPQDGTTFALALERWLKSASQARPPLLTTSAVSSIPAAAPRSTPHGVISRASGGFPAPLLVLSLLAAGAMALVAILRPSDDDAAPATRDEPTAQSPSVQSSGSDLQSQNFTQKKAFQLENHKSEMRNLLTRAANELVTARQRNVVAFQREVAGREKTWAPFLSLIDQGRGLLPRYIEKDPGFTPAPEMSALASRYAFDHQGQLEYRHLGVIKKLHRTSIETLQAQDVHQSSSIMRSELEWIEWIGASTFKILARPPDGEWVLRFAPEDASAIHLIFGNEGMVQILDEGHLSKGQFSTTANGELHVIRPGEGGNWTLRWREPWLEGRDHEGRKVRFRRRAFTFERSLEDKTDGLTPRGEKLPSNPAIEDSELARLQKQFRDTLQRRLTPWFQSYIGKIDELMEPTGKNTAHLEKERQRIADLDWESGLLSPGSVVSRSFIPPELRGSRNRLQAEVLKILIDVQDTYRNLLISLRRKRISSGGKTTEVQAELLPFLSMRRVSLESFYNADADGGTWLDSRSAARQILPAFDGCRSRRVPGYKISGILQMNSGIYPDSNSRLGGRDMNTYYKRNWPMVIGEIPVYQKADNVYLVGGLIWSYEPSGAEVARITLNYLDGSKSPPAPLLNQQHIADWYSSRSIPKAERVWRGKRRESGRQCAVYEMEIPNPRIGAPIKSITIESSGKSAAPFFLGISLGETGTGQKRASSVAEPEAESPMQRADRKLRERLARESADRERKRKEEEQRRRKSLERPR